MSDMNYIGAIVKVLETPKKKFINSKTLVVTFKAQLPQTRKNRIVKLVCWGNLAQSVTKHYNVNDYILIEGYVSFRENKNLSKKNKSFKKVIITALKVYPFFLNSKQLTNKLS